MRIGIDTRDLAIARTGARTYLEEMLSALQVSEHKIVTLHPHTTTSSAQRSLLTKTADQFAFIKWKQFDLPALAKQHQCDVLFCTDYTVPMQSEVPAIPVFHDANFWVNPDQYNWLWRKSLDLITVPAAKQAPAVVTTTEFARKDISAYTGIPSAKIVAIPIAPKAKAVASLSRADVQRVLTQYNIDPSIPFILHVGVTEKRKNLARLIHAFAHFRQFTAKPYNLVLVGQRGPRRDMDDMDNIVASVAELKLTEVVRIVGYVPDDALPAFYQSASIFVFPSTREGFGIPILEAFSHKLPVAAANSSAIPEVAGDAALLFDPTNLHEIAEALLQVAENENLRTQLIAKGTVRLQQFSWGNSARQLISLFEHVIASC